MYKYIFIFVLVLGVMLSGCAGGAVRVRSKAVMLDDVISVRGVLLLKQATGKLGGASGYFLQTHDQITLVLPPELAKQKPSGNLYELAIPPNVSVDRSKLGHKVTLVGTFENGHGFYATPLIFMVSESK